MATVTPNFNWPVPTSTDLVKDGATAIEALGDSIDASLVDLKGGTTGQILSKTSATDMDFTWVNNDQGDITEVIAGSGISVTSSTGPTPTVALDLTAANVYTAAQTATRYIVTGSTIPTNGMYLPTANNLGFSTNSTARLTIGTTTLSSTLSTTDLAVGTSLSAVLQLGNGRTADNNSYIDLVGDTTYADYGLRIIRNSGANGGSQLVSRGTGGFSISTQDAAALSFQTQLTTRMSIGSGGEIGIGFAPTTARTVTIAKNMTGSTVSYGINNAGQIQSDVTSNARMYISQPSTQATAFTVTELSGFYAGVATIGAGSAITNQYGFIVGAGFTGATNNYGFMAQSNAATGVWNFYASGTAANHFAGRVGIGTAITTTYQARISNVQSTSDITLATTNFAAQTADSLAIQNSAGSSVFGVTAAGFMKYSASNTATTVGAAGAASALPANPTGYLKIDIGGTEYKVPYYAA